MAVLTVPWLSAPQWRYLTALADGQQLTNEEVIKHAAQCGICRYELEALATMVSPGREDPPTRPMDVLVMEPLDRMTVRRRKQVVRS